MKQLTLCFCLSGDQVLLAMKKRGFGAGKWNGYGGKLQEGESVKTATVRELAEESSLVAEEKDLQQVALVHFYFDEKLMFDCSVFLLRTWQGSPVETEEMRPQWYPVAGMPFHEMWAGDAKWIPLILAGQKIEVDTKFNTDGSVLTGFEYKPAQFS